MAELIQILKKFEWKILGRYFGCAHDSTIGFLASQWIAADPENNAIIDGPPCVHIDVGGQDRRRHADILMFSNNEPALVVEEALHGLLVLYGEKDGITINYVQKLLADNSHSILLLHIEAENEWQQLQHKEDHKEEQEMTLDTIRLKKGNGYYFWRRIGVKLYIPGCPQEALWPTR